MKTILFILAAIFTTLLLIVVFIVLEYLGQSKSTPNDPKLAFPTLIPSQKNTTSPPPVSYDSEKSNKLIDLSKNRRALSENGQNTKNKIFQNLNNNSGEVFTNNNVQIAYIASMDAFIAEIRNINILQAKKDAVNFLTSQGFTKDDVCKLPLSFYLNSEVKKSILGSHIVFNPLPEGC